MNRTTRAGFLIALWGMCLFFFREDPTDKISLFVGLGWIMFGGYLFLKQD